MNAIVSQPNPSWTIEQLRRHFGGIPAERILLDPAPGTATEKDAYRLNEYKGKNYELADGVLVEKDMGVDESGLAFWLGRWIFAFLEEHPLGKLVGEKAFFRLMPGLIRAPDVSFIRWERYPKGKPSMPAVCPDLAVEVLSKGNTKKELARKRREYFACGASLVWEVNPRAQTVDVYTSPTEFKRLGVSDTLDGGTVLPGFTLTVAKLFAIPGPPAGWGEE